MARRKPISKRLRFLIHQRDDFTCRYCGAKPSQDVSLHIDHVVAVASGGTNDPRNLVTACRDCNLGKGAMPLSPPPLSAEQVARLRAESEALSAYVDLLNNETLGNLGVPVAIHYREFSRGPLYLPDRFLDYVERHFLRWIHPQHIDMYMDDAIRARTPAEALERFTADCWSDVMRQRQ